MASLWFTGPVCGAVNGKGEEQSHRSVWSVIMLLSSSRASVSVTDLVCEELVKDTSAISQEIIADDGRIDVSPGHDWSRVYKVGRCQGGCPGGIGWLRLSTVMVVVVLVSTVSSWVEGKERATLVGESVEGRRGWGSWRPLSMLLRLLPGVAASPSAALVLCAAQRHTRAVNEARDPTRHFTSATRTCK